MCNLRHQVPLIFAFSFVSICHCSVLSSGIANHVSGLTTQSLINAQKSKSFLVVDESVLIASDPSGREPDDFITSSPNEGDTLSTLYLDKVAGRIFYKVTWGDGERVESRGLFGEDLQVLVSFTKSAIYSESHQKLYWTRDDAVRSIKLDGSDHSIVAKQSDVYTNDLTGWAWLGIYPWVYDQGEDDWMDGGRYFCSSSTNWPMASWSTCCRCEWLDTVGTYPWVYVNGFASGLHSRRSGHIRIKIELGLEIHLPRFEETFSLHLDESITRFIFNSNHRVIQRSPSAHRKTKPKHWSISTV